MKRIGCLLFTTFLLSASALADGVMSLAGSEWGEGAESKVVVQFAGDGKVSGNLGCNRFFATYSQDGSAVAIGALGSTKMLCPEPMMKTEARVSAALATTKSADITHLKLILRDASGKELLALQRRDFD